MIWVQIVYDEANLLSCQAKIQSLDALAEVNSVEYTTLVDVGALELG